MDKYIYGIDFGTTNSALAILDLGERKIIKVFTVPSLIFFPQKQNNRKYLKYFIGKEAISEYVDSEMNGRFLKSIKKILPQKKFAKANILTRSYKPEELVALIILELKNKADRFLGEKVTTAIIGRPVVFDENPIKDECAQIRLSKAAEIVGFKKIHFQMEPIAAAYAYEKNIKNQELVLVADFGGGTSDFTLMNLAPTSISKFNRGEDMIAKGGIYIGGDNFDSDIMWNIGTPHFGRGVKEKIDDQWLNLPNSYFLNICTWEKMNFLNSIKMRRAIGRSYVFSKRNQKVKNLMTLLDNNLGYMFFKEIEKSKIELTKEDIVCLMFQKLDINIREEIKIEEFSKVINPNLTKINNYLDSFLTKNGINSKDIDTVFMTGGTSLVRPLKNIIEDKFSKNKIRSGDNFNSVAIGLAYSFYLLNAN